MAITQRNFTTSPGKTNNPNPSNIPDDPTKKEKEVDTPERKRLLKQKENIEKRLKKIEKNTFLANIIRETAYLIKAQENPYEVSYLYNQVLPTLKKLGINNIIEKNEVQILENEQDGDMFLYKVMIRRNDIIDPDIIDRMDRNLKLFKDLSWTSDGIQVFVWAENELLTEEKRQEEEAKRDVDVEPAIPPGP